MRNSMHNETCLSNCNNYSQDNYYSDNYYSPLSRHEFYRVAFYYFKLKGYFGFGTINNGVFLDSKGSSSRSSQRAYAGQVDFTTKDQFYSARF